jgi:hypothetical protein
MSAAGLNSLRDSRDPAVLLAPPVAALPVLINHAAEAGAGSLPFTVMLLRDTRAVVLPATASVLM